LSSLWGSGVYLGVAYGFRHLTESIVLLAPGLALVIDRLPVRLARCIVALCCLCALWNLILIAEYRYGLLPADSGGDLFTMLANAIKLTQRKRLWILSQVVIIPILVWLFAGRLAVRRNPGIRRLEVLSY
jgi:hypothetical protein